MIGREARQFSEEMASPWLAPGRMGEDIALPTGGEFGFARIKKAMGEQVAAAWAACGAFERMAFTYLAVSSLLIVLFARNLQHPVRLLAVRAFIVVIILSLCRVWAPSAARAAVDGATITTRYATLARREVAGVRSLAHRRATHHLAGAICNSRPQ
jgi:hypothetical protein